MKKLLKKLAPDRFEDIIAVLALYRPGPLGSGMVDDFILRKKGQQKIDYFHPDLNACLSPTYGVIVYQEQVMQISQIIGGYTLGGADMLRRAMGKKKAEEMAEHRDTIAAGATEEGLRPGAGEQLFDLMTKFAEYGFNKSHTAAYAVVTYHTAWLKAHHCSAFMAATMSSDMDNTDSVKIFYDDAIVNKSEGARPGRQCLRIPLRAGRPRDHPLWPRRSQGHRRAGGQRHPQGARDGRAVQGSVRLLPARRQAHGQPAHHRGADPGRVRSTARRPPRTLLASVGIAMDSAEQAERNAMQVSLFDFGTVAEEHAPQYVEVPPLERKAAADGGEDGARFLLLRPSLQRQQEGGVALYPAAARPARTAKELPMLAGLVVGVRTKITRRGKMLFVQLDDGTAMVEVSVFNELFEAERAKIVTDEVLIIEGKVRTTTLPAATRSLPTS